MNKRITIYLFAVLSLVGVHAQNKALAEEIFEFVQTAQGDSVYARMNAEIQKQISAQDLSGIFRQMERQCGKYQSHSDWQADSIGKNLIYYTDVKFANYELRLLTSFDNKGKATALNFIPKPADVEVSPVEFDDSKMLEEDFMVTSGEFKLPGTLTLPKQVENPPVVILVHGSGPHDRDETIVMNKPFRDLAWGLSTQGIAVLRYDKRTLVYKAKSAPDGKINYDSETVDDALAAVQNIRADKRFEKSEVYIIGHSLGAMLAPRIAERDTTLSGIVMIAAPARSLGDVIPEQMEYLASISGVTEKTKQEIEQVKRQAANVKKLGTDEYDASIPSLLNMPQSYWEFSNTYNQVDVAKKLTLPVLILQGERDYQVTMQDFGLWRMGLLRHRNVLFKSYPKLNHLMMEGSGKSFPIEYTKKNAIPAYVLNDIAGWVMSKKIE